jgi:two-component system alkaline phosphatase synthesis response regulator PhoP/two-component system response regulator VicR
MQKHVLAVDDENNIRRLIEVNLLRAGYRVTSAADGEEALQKIREDRPDLIVSDVMMPKVDGFELLRRLKADPETMDIPVLMLTAKAQDRDIFAGWSGGVHGYLSKPFNPGELLTWVAKTLESVVEAQDAGRLRL